MAEASKTTVGERLREAREKKGVSLRQIAATTRISVMSLEALERHDASRLPGGIFTRAFVRAYAQEVGLDPERAVQDFIEQFPSDSAVASRHPTPVEDAQAFENERRAAETAVRLVLWSIPIAALVLYFGMRGRPEPPASPANHAVESDVAPVRETPPPAPSPLAEVQPPAAAGLVLAIAPRGPCWVSVSVDGEPKFSGLMRAGEQREIAARERIELTVGDAGAFAYTINGAAGRPLGAPGAVVGARFTMENFREFLVR
jgi:cytoskeleton protein RodZ